MTKLDFYNLFPGFNPGEGNGYIIGSNPLVVNALRHLSEAINFRRNYPTLNFSEQLSAQVPARNRSVLCSDDGWVQVAADSSAMLQLAESLLRYLSWDVFTWRACPDSNRNLSHVFKRAVLMNAASFALFQLPVCVSSAKGLGCRMSSAFQVRPAEAKLLGSNEVQWTQNCSKELGHSRNDPGHSQKVVALVWDFHFAHRLAKLMTDPLKPQRNMGLSYMPAMWMENELLSVALEDGIFTFCSSSLRRQVW